MIMMTVMVMTTIGKDRSSKTLLALPSFSHGLLCRRRSRRAFKISTLKIFNSFQIWWDWLIVCQEKPILLTAADQVSLITTCHQALELRNCISPYFGDHHLSSSLDLLFGKNWGHGLLTVPRGLGTSIEPLLGFYCWAQYWGWEISAGKIGKMEKLRRGNSTCPRFQQEFYHKTNSLRLSTMTNCVTEIAAFKFPPHHHHINTRTKVEQEIWELFQNHAKDILWEESATGATATLLRHLSVTISPLTTFWRKFWPLL